MSRRQVTRQSTIESDFVNADMPPKIDLYKDENTDQLGLGIPKLFSAEVWDSEATDWPITHSFPPEDGNHREAEALSVSRHAQYTKT